MSAGSRNAVVLIIDDDAGDRKALQRALLKSGLPCTVIKADSFGNAVKMFSDDTKPDFILLDHLIPGEDSLASIVTLQRIWPAAGLAMITGQGDEDIATRALKAGALDYISKRKATEEAIRRIVENGIEMQRLRIAIETQREELESFAHALAHDLKAPLRNIAFLQTCLEEDVEAGNHQQALEDAKDIGTCANRATALVEGLTVYLELGAKAEVKSANLSALAQDAIMNLQTEIEQKRAKVRVGAMPCVSCVPVELVQLLQNLIANGIKYCRDKPPEIDLSAELDPQGNCTVCVQDNGIGIDAEYAEKIFEPFARLHGDGEFAGSGLGLATCRKIVSRLGGRIWCDSKPNDGSRFYFQLPATDAAEHAA